MPLRPPFLLVVTLFASTVFGQSETRPRIRPLPKQSLNAKSGPAVGSPLPAFEAMDAEGKKQTFETLKGPKGLVLAFQRSADWCPYCKTQLVDLNSKLEDFRKKGMNVVSLTYDSAAVLQNFAARQNIKFVMLSDPESKVIRTFDILNTNVEPGTPQYGIPFPGTYVVNQKGIITAKYFSEDYTERYSAASILTREYGVDGVLKETVETPQLKLTYSASDSTLAPGRRVTLIIDVQAKPKMHVYAPGVEHYIPIDWEMKESKYWVALPAAYPASRMLNLPVIKETVPVFDGKFRIVRDVAIGLESELAPAFEAERTLAIEGTFRYQACDDKECYLPKTLPLKWTFPVGKLDTQRVPEPLQRKPK